jgi:hypothetical protein
MGRVGQVTTRPNSTDGHFVTVRAVVLASLEV